MKSKIVVFFIIILCIISACKKDNLSTIVDPRITAHYLFKPGTYWVYASSLGVDSEFVSATGSRNGLPYMQIQKYINGTFANTIYIGVGPAGHQLQLWGYDYLNHTDLQAIFDVDTPAQGKIVAPGLVFAGFLDMSGEVPHDVPGIPYYYYVDYPNSNKNQEVGYVDYYFYPDFGIVQKTEYATLAGDVYANLSRSHIIQ